MGGGGGSSYRGSPEDLARTRDQVRQELQEQELVAEINQFLAEELAGFNDRDIEAVTDKLNSIEEALQDLGHEIERLLFGGSVAKHTYVDGLSDVDSLVFLDSAPSVSPADVIAAFAEVLSASLPHSQVKEITTGNMAVTVQYRDGTTVQLLPATERGDHTVIPSADGTTWKAIRPHKFTEKLTEVNQRNGNGVVPVIKLAKGLIRGFTEEQRLSGYHVECLAVDAFKRYSGPRDRASMLNHLLGHAAQAILSPTGDLTGQSVHVDSYLGQAGSAARRNVSRTLRAAESKLRSADSVDAYRDLFS